jgi:hypothetical protein
MEASHHQEWNTRKKTSSNCRWLFEKLFEINRTFRIMTGCSKNCSKLLEHFELWLTVWKMFEMIQTNSSQKCLAVSFWQFGSWLFKILRTVLRIDLLLDFVGWEAKFRCVYWLFISKVFFTVSVMFLWYFSLIKMS